MKKKIILILFSILAIICVVCIKNLKIGKDTNSQEIDIFNISSYEAIIDMTVYSNKNENRYKIKQNYKKGIESSQEIIEPSNIKGIKITQKAEKLILENSRLNLTNVIENYPYIANNCIDLISFIEEYKQNKTSSMKEEGDTIILETTSSSENPYIKYKILTLDKKTSKPLQMEIKSDNQKTTIYILYNEVKIKNN